MSESRSNTAGDERTDTAPALAREIRSRMDAVHRLLTAEGCDNDPTMDEQLLALRAATLTLGDACERMEESVRQKDADLRMTTAASERLEMDLRRAERRIQLAAAASSDLIYEWDLSSDDLLWFGDVDGALGLPEGGLDRTISAWMSRIHPEDNSQLRSAVEAHRTSAEHIKYEYRIGHEDGTWLHWSDRAGPVPDEDGRPRRWIGTCSDVTELRTAGNELQQRVEELSQAKRRLEVLLADTTSRESRMVALKAEVNGLLVAAGRETKYSAPTQVASFRSEQAQRRETPTEGR